MRCVDYNQPQPLVNYNFSNFSRVAVKSTILQSWLPLQHQALSKSSSRVSMTKNSRYTRVAKQSMTIQHMIEDRLTSSSPIVIPNVSGNILAKIVEYYKHAVIKPPSGLVNDNEETLFGLLVATDYLAKKELLFLACEDVLDLIKRRDLEHIYKLFNIMLEFSLEREKKI
ncbi:hypothetical protein M9H77_03606 [Catharanthus roseus]|uniref:Uncharacterized protein n=1 Tax=Catharanthus roseus TaxID=4058 RepID=A0ACC0CC89_CATRO|nr:hypothetical protein M9H77_03606 [Catharanthus roseus]